MVVFGELLGAALKATHVGTVFAVPGVPITETLNVLMRNSEIDVCCMKHECNAMNAAAAYGYQGGRYCYRSALNETRPSLYASPGVAITTSGPAFLNACSQFVTAAGNRYPCVLISSSHFPGPASKPHSPTMFQALDQLALAQSYVEQGLLKAADQVVEVSKVFEKLLKAVQQALEGRPGAVYLDIPWALWNSQADLSDLGVIREFQIAPVERPTMDLVDDEGAMRLTLSGRTLLVYGEGLTPLTSKCIARHEFPVFASVGARALVHPHQDVRCCRSRALRECETIVLIGADLDWKYDCTNAELWKCKRIVSAGYTKPTLAEVKLCNKSVQVLDAPFDGGKIEHWETCPAHFLENLAVLWDEGKFYTSEQLQWRDSLLSENKEKLAASVPRAVLRGSAMEGTRQCSGVHFRDVFEILSASAKSHSHVYVISEGATSFDQSRKYLELPNLWSKCYDEQGGELDRLDIAKARWLDPGAFGAMGLGLPFAIGTACWAANFGAVNSSFPSGRVIASLGDSAAGFSGMELETIARYKLPIAVLVLDNGGVYAIKPTRLSTHSEASGTSSHASDHGEGQRCRFQVDATDLKEVDWSNIVPSLSGSKISTLDQLSTELKTSLRDFLESGSARVLHIKCDPRDGSGEGFIANHH